jgi:multidrug efflux pump subunit AcrB
VSGPIAWFARNPVAANLLMAMMLAGGLLALPSLRQEMFPDVELDVVTIAVPYPGASPVEVEEGVCVPVEEALQGLAGIKRIRSTASESVAMIAIELMSGEDVARRLADIRARVDAIDTLPEEAERPIVSQAELPRQVLSIAIYGDANERVLEQTAQRARDELSALPEISEVSLAAVRPHEIAIEVSEAALERHRLDFDQVAAAVRRGSLDLPAGVVRAQAGEILLRAEGKARSGEEFARIPVLVRRDGTRLTVGDVARVIDGFAETDQRASFDGKPAALIQVSRVGDQRVIDVSEAARAYVAGARGALPPGVEMVIWQDMSTILAERLGSMKSNAWQGALMVVVVLALFLRLRLAAWVAWGVPTALLGTFAVLPFLGVSINWISLMGLVLVLGILVDDAIVVGENTYVEQQRSASKLEGAIRGARGLATPVIFGVLTTVAAFLPMLAVPGSMGKLTRSLPIVVIASLLFSLIESLWILPAHLATGGPVDAPPRGAASRRWRALQDRVSGGFDRWVERVFAPFLGRALEWRYFAIACGVAALLITGALVAGDWLRFTFQEPVDGDVIIADLTMEPGTPAHVTAAAIRTLEEAAREVQREADAQRDLRHGSIFTHVLASVGEQPFREFQASMPNGGSSAGSGGHLGELQVEMIAADHRDIATSEMQRRWRAAAPAIPGVAELAFQNTMVSSGKPIELELRGNDLAQLRRAAAWLKGEIAQYPGVFDVADSFRAGKQELRFDVLPSAEALGFSLADVARQVRQAFWGEEVQRVQRGRDELRVVVRYPAEQRRSLGDLDALRIRTADGVAVPFASVARAELTAGYSAIQRVDRTRVVAVTADVDVALGNANAVIESLQAAALPALAQRFPGVTFGFAGQQAEQREFLGAMLRGQILALLAIYALLAVPLRSYTQPIIIMSIIPFGVVGTAVGHLLLGFDLSMYSVIGLLALSGIVVNSSLVLVDQVNVLRAAGLRLADAAREAATSRVRAIFLTEITTFVGLIPMMFDTALAARMTIPLAITLAFGVLFAAVITLVLLPCMYLVLEDVTLLVRGTRRTRSGERRRRSGASEAPQSAGEAPQSEAAG